MGIIESVQQYDLNIPAGGAQNIDVAGDRIQFISAGDPFAQIEIRPNYAQGNISLKPGQGFRFSEQVTRWVVFNRGSVALTGYLLIGSGDFFDQRISGDVNVIDGGKSRTLASGAFFANLYCGNVAAQKPHVQLWNPAGSGKNVIVEHLYVNCASTAAMQFAFMSSALATFTANCQSKLSGGATAVAQARYETNAVNYLGGATLLGSAQLTANLTAPFPLREPIVIRPGYGLAFQTQVDNSLLQVCADFYEESI